jgi:hypothetical protein
VYLLRRNIKTRRLSIKLDHTKLRLFKILRKQGLVTYKLELLPNIRIHSIFHVALLELALPRTWTIKLEIALEL